MGQLDPPVLKASPHRRLGRAAAHRACAGHASAISHEVTTENLCSAPVLCPATAWNSHDGMVQAIRINNGASDLVYACGAGLLINTFAPIGAGVFKGAGLIIRGSRLAAGKVAGVSGSCKAAYTMLQAADATASLADYEGANNPVFLEADTRSTGTPSATGAPLTSASAPAPSSGSVTPLATAASARLTTTLPGNGAADQRNARDLHGQTQAGRSRAP